MKQFFITFFANLAALFFVFGGPMLLIIILIVASVSAGASKKQHSTSIDRGSILVFDMSMNVTDSPEHATSTDAVTNALSNSNVKTVALHRLLNAIQKASRDERIKGMLLEGSFEPADFGTGYACLKEVREAIADFKKGDGKTAPPKPVYAYLESPSTRDYYVASVASTIWMNPYGEMEMPGLAIVKTYYKGALDKYGVDVQVTRHGKYKSATEPFFLTKMSDADREETQRLIDGLWGDFITAVTQSRAIDAKTLQGLVDTEGYILPEDAKKQHLIDDTKYFGDVLTEMGKIAPSSDFAKIPLPFKQVAIGDYITASHTPRLLGERGSDNIVAVLYLEGEIVDGDGALTNIGGDRFASELRDLKKDSDVKAVVLRVNSPGGSAYASEVIQREILALKASGKPVIVSMGNYAASGGYWVSTYADYIFAEPNTITGSIGVFGMFMDYEKLANSVGVTFDVAKTGQYADFESSSRPKTDAEVALAQARVDDLYGKFLDKVSESRHIPRGADTDPKTVDAIAQGRVWLGTDALPLHLIDEIGGLHNAITYAANKAKLGDRYRVKEYPEEVTFADTLAALLSNQEEPLSKVKADPFTQAFIKIRHDLKEFQGFNDPIGVYARMPIGWRLSSAVPPEDARFPDAVSLEEATLSDHETVIGLIRDYYAYDEIPFLESAIAPGLRALLGGPEFGRVFLVKSGSDIAGYVIFTFGFDLEFGGRQATITDFFLRPNFRRLGLGTKAFRLLESQCAKLGVMALELQPERDNTEAYAFYRKMGFKALDRTPMSKRIVA